MLPFKKRVSAVRSGAGRSELPAESDSIGRLDWGESGFSVAGCMDRNRTSYNRGHFAIRGDKMNRVSPWRRAGALAVCLLGVVLLSGPSTAREPSTSSRTKWEYAELRQFTGRVLLTLPGAEFETETFYEACSKLKAKKRDNSSLAVLNALGDDGWELVSSVVSTGPGVRQVWTFKRFRDESNGSTPSSASTSR